MNRFIATLICSTFALAAEASNVLSPSVPTNDPEELVKAFCQADNDGLFTSSAGWPLVQKFTVWEDGPGWDIGYVVKSFKTSLIENTGVIARVEVTYDILGRLAHSRPDGGWTIDTADGGVRRIVYRLQQKHGVWRIVEPQLPPHVSVKYAIKHIGNECGKYECDQDPTVYILRNVLK